VDPPRVQRPAGLAPRIITELAASLAILLAAEACYLLVSTARKTAPPDDADRVITGAVVILVALSGRWLIRER
jgi:hypothetical protein